MMQNFTIHCCKPLADIQNVSEFASKELMECPLFVYKNMHKMTDIGDSDLCIYLKIKHYLHLPLERKII
jgi:hypothetical protein